MSRPDTIIIDGRAYSWRALSDLRRRQLEVWRQTRHRQDALFELHEDRRPAAERSASSRYHQPTLLAWLKEDG